MLSSAANGVFPADKILADWWRSTFLTRDLPEGKTVHEIALAIEYALVYQEGGVMTEKFLRNHIAATNFRDADFEKSTSMIFNAIKANDFLSRVIHFNSQEGAMSVSKGSKTTKTVKTASLTKPAAAAPKTAKKAEPADAPRVTAKSRIKELLFAAKSTDEEIAEILAKEFPDTFKKNYISITRSDINAGRVSGYEGEHLDRLVRSADGKLAPFVAGEKVAKPKVDKKAEIARITKALPAGEKKPSKPAVPAKESKPKLTKKTS
jgi:hypothetical protein